MESLHLQVAHRRRVTDTGVAVDNWAACKQALCAEGQAYKREVLALATYASRRERSPLAMTQIEGETELISTYSPLCEWRDWERPTVSYECGPPGTYASEWESCARDV